MKSNWLIGISACVAGLLLLISPSFCIKLIIVLFGLTAIIEGLYGIITERKLFDNLFFQKTTLYKSIGNIVVGALTIVMPLAIAGTAWAVMTYVLAVYLILSSCAGFVASSKIKQTQKSEEKTDMKQLSIENIVTLAAGLILLIIGPAKLGSMILRIIGLISLVIGVGFIVAQIMEKNKKIIVTDVKVSDYDSEITEETSN